MKVHELPDEVMGHVGSAISRVARAVGATDYNILNNNGAPAHQAVPHVHFHIIPKRGDKGLGIKWDAQAADKGALAALAESIKAKI